HFASHSTPTPMASPRFGVRSRAVGSAAVFSSFGPFTPPVLHGSGARTGHGDRDAHRRQRSGTSGVMARAPTQRGTCTGSTQLAGESTKEQPAGPCVGRYPGATPPARVISA